MKSLGIKLPPGLASATGPRRRRAAPAVELVEAERFLCLDVSSSATGFAIVHRDGSVPRDGFGVLVPFRNLSAAARIDATADAVRDLLAEYDPPLVVLEWSAGLTAGRLRKASGLAVLGQAQGAVREVVRSRGIPVVTVPETVWCRARPKTKRALDVELVCPRYAAFRLGGGDPGMDAGDALGLGFWYAARLREAALTKGV